MASFCNKTSGSMRGGEILDYLHGMKAYGGVDV
jgi:hypothetical protein